MKFEFLKIDDLIDQPLHLILGFFVSLLLTWIGIPVILSVVIMVILAYIREVWQKYTKLHIFTIKDAIKDQFEKPGSWFDLLFFLIGGILCILFHDEAINFLSHLLSSF